MQNLGRTGRLVELLAGTLEFGMHHPLWKYVCCIPCRARVGNQAGTTNWSRKTTMSQSLGWKMNFSSSTISHHFLDYSLISSLVTP
jgi:hypothetical protein